MSSTRHAIQLMAELKNKGFREERCGIRRESSIQGLAADIEVRFDGPCPFLDRSGACLDTLELTVVARAVQAHEDGVGEAHCRGEAEKTCDEKKNLLYSEWLDADWNHADYGYYQHWLYQIRAEPERAEKGP